MCEDHCEVRRWLRTAGLASLILITLWLGVAAARGDANAQCRPVLNAGAQQSSTISAEPTPSRDPASDGAVDGTEVLARLEVVEQRVEDSQNLLETQRAVFTATVNRMESNFTLLIAIIAIAGLAVALLGVRLVREMVQRAVESRLSTITEERLTRAIEDEVGRLRSENDGRFAALYDEYRKVVDHAKR
jgi:hypothetical protein